MGDWDDAVPIKKQTVFFFARGMKTLWKLLGTEKNNILRVFILLISIQFLDLLSPLFLKLIFDELWVIGVGRKVSSTAIWCISAMCITQVLSIVIKRFFEEPLLIKSILRLENWWPVMAQEKLLELSLSYHERENTGKKIAKISKGCEKLLDVITSLFWGLLPALFYLVLNIILILTMDWMLGLLFLLPLIPAVWINLKSYERFTPIWEEWEKKKEIANGFFCQSLVNVQTVQSFVRENHEKMRLASIRREMEIMDLDASLAVQKYFLAMGFILRIFFVFTIAAGVLFISYGWSTPGTVIYIATTGYVTIQHLWEIVHVYTRILRNIVAAERMHTLMGEPVEIKNMPNAITPPRFRGDIEFCGVTFKYAGQERKVLRKISFAIEPGKMAALVGKSGSGKTTAVKLLTRMYDTTSGAILADGADIKTLDRGWYRKLFAAVQQNVDIFDATLVENVSYGKQDASEAEIIQVFEAAHLAEVIRDKNRFPYGIYTEVGERGVRLSGGERQRVGIARAYLALLGGARILILDEATSSLDSEAERAIQGMIDKLRSTLAISIVAIAHRLSTIQKADHIYVLEDGAIIETGNHEKLIRQNGLYAKLVNLQTLGELRE
ncbi:MAG: ABC transporter ATP-binding protein [Candidatus Sungbacteria bacterium]|nr:ABC transporter ATP-binding protein [Candidatus Sungbacteria bacterium]